MRVMNCVTLLHKSANPHVNQLEAEAQFVLAESIYYFFPSSPSLLVLGFRALAFVCEMLLWAALCVDKCLQNYAAGLICAE